MNEHTLENRCMDVLKAGLPGVLLWKIADRFTLGKPDHEINWSGHTTKIEFKLLRNGEGIHDQLAPDQLVSCIEYENTTQKCWIVAWVEPVPRKDILAHTLIFKPSVLYPDKQPRTMVRSKWNEHTVLALWQEGVISFAGYNHDAVLNLIKATHR